MLKKKNKDDTQIKEPHIKHVNKKNMLISIIALILAVVMFVGLVYVERFVNTPITYQNVVVANTDIEAGIVITESNVDTYFETISSDVSQIPIGAFSDTSELIGQKTCNELITGEMVFDKDFVDTNDLISNFEDPVEVSVGISTLADANAGSIRAGDLVNLTIAIANQTEDTSDVVYESSGTPVYELETGTPIWQQDETETSESEIETETENTEIEVTDVENTTGNVNTDTKKSETTTSEQNNTTETYGSNKVIYVMENVYVKEVYDANGTIIASDDTTTPAVIIKFLVEKSDELVIDNAVVNGSSMRVSKIVDIKDVYEDRIDNSESVEESTEK